MLSEVIRLSLNNRLAVIVLTILMASLGIYSASRLPIDAVPDMTNVQVQVVTKSGGLSPLEVERFVTYPIETAMAGLPHVEEIRSVSQLGISSVTIVFHEGTDVYRSRQLITERLVDAVSKIPPGYGTPELGPLTTALGEVLQFEVRGQGYSAMDLRTILEWQVAPQMRQIPGVTEINSHGGFYKSFEVRVQPDRMTSLHVSLEEVFDALERNNKTTGGGYVVHHGEQRFIRGQSLLGGIESIQNVVVRDQENGVPILIRDLADVTTAPLVRQGAVTRDGRGEIVTGMVMMLLGENSRQVVNNAKSRLGEIQQTLPPGVQVEILYDRAELINRTLRTVFKNLQEGEALVIIVLLMFLGNFRAGLIVALAIPLSMLFATNIMAATGITASLMSLGAIDFGMIVDSSVIMIENCMRRLALNSHATERQPHIKVVEDAAIEVRTPTMFGELIIAIVYLPILGLQGTEGKLFRPMALTVLIALFGSMILSMTLMPVLASLLLPKETEEHDAWLIRVVKWFYRPVAGWVIRHPVWTVCLSVLLFLSSIPVGMNLGAEFMPRLEEGDLLIEVNRLPSATLEDSVPMSTQIETLLREFDEVRTVFCKTGRPEIANDLMGVQQTDVWVILKPVERWKRKKSREELFEEMSKVLTEHVPGAVFAFTQPIAMRVDELVAGVKAEVAALLYGDDLEVLASKGKEIEALLKTIPGAVDVKADYQANLTSLRIRTRPEQLARYGIEGSQVMSVVESLAGKEVGLVFEEQARFPIVVRVPQAWRESQALLERIPVTQTGKRVIPLGDLTEITLEESPPSVQHEANRRRTFVQCNVRGRDVATFVQEAQRVVREKIQLPPGYLVRWGGDFEHLQSASWRLAWITPLALLLILMLLHTSLGSVRMALLIFLAVPIAASGGVFALALRGMPFSISAGVGFIALFGVAVLNGLVWVSSAEALRREGTEPHAVARETAELRLRPVLMTAMVASLGFLPMALSTTAGAEIQRPLATVVIGGLITSTLLTSCVVPAIYPWFVSKSDDQVICDTKSGHGTDV